MFDSRKSQYKKLQLISYVCLVGSFFLVPVLKAESSAIKEDRRVIDFMEHTAKIGESSISEDYFWVPTIQKPNPILSAKREKRWGFISFSFF